MKRLAGKPAKLLRLRSGVRLARRRTRRFNKIHLLVFALVFAGLGSYLIFHSLADVITNPTHLIDDQWNFPSSGDNYTITSLSTDITPEVNGAPDGYFYATEFYFYNNFTGYMGLQDEGNDGNGVTYAKTAMISIYGATGVSAASGIIGNCGNPSGEGQECALHDVYNWAPGHDYRFTFALQTANDGNRNEIWSVKFSDVTLGTTVQLGTLSVPTSWEYLGHAIITFHERFSGLTASCSDIHPSFVTFSNVNAVDGAGPIAGTASATFSSGSNQCAGYLDNYVKNNVVYSGYGPDITSYEPAACPVGDLNGDCRVSITDLSILLSKWGANYPPADFNKDGKVDISDLSILISHFQP